MIGPPVHFIFSRFLPNPFSARPPIKLLVKKQLVDVLDDDVQLVHSTSAGLDVLALGK
jgi:hypothetical protein